jgi:hypothetical protein
MAKAAPNSQDKFKANCDRVTPLLEKLKAEGIGHMINGKIVPSVSGKTFETKSPVDGAVLALVARGSAEDIDYAATVAAETFKSWRTMPASSIAARPIASWPRPRSAPRRIFVTSPTNAETPVMDLTCRAMSTGTFPPACRSARSA